MWVMLIICLNSEQNYRASNTMITIPGFTTPQQCINQGNFIQTRKKNLNITCVEVK